MRLYKVYVILPLAIVMLGATAFTGRAGEGFIGRILYSSGDMAPGTGDGPGGVAKKFSSFKSPHVNQHGDQAFVGELEASGGNGIWLVPSQGDPRLVALEGDVSVPWLGLLESNPVLGTGIINDLDLVGIDDVGRIFFTADGAPISIFPFPTLSLYMWDPAGGGQVTRILSSGYPANGRTISEGEYSETDSGGGLYRFGNFHQIQVSPSGVVSFVASYGTAGSYSTEVGLWRIPDPTVAVVNSVFPIPSLLSVDLSENGNQIEIVVDRGTETEMEACMVLPRSGVAVPERSYLGTAGAAVLEVSSGDPAPAGSGANFTYLGRPAAAPSGVMAFWAETDSEMIPEGIWVKGAQGYELLVKTGDRLEAGAAKVSELSDPVVNKKGLVGFKSKAALGSDEIWLGNSKSALHRAVRAGVTPTGRGSNQFTKLGNPILNDRGQVLFSALVDDGSGAKFGYWAMTSVGCVAPLLVTGDELSLDLFDSVNLAQMEISDLSASGHIAMALGYEDGRSSIVSIEIEPVGPTGYAEWAELNIPNPVDRDPTADIDLDGRSNLAEFAFDTNPGKSDIVSREVLQQSVVQGGDGEFYLEYSVVVRAGVEGDVLYELQQSRDLASWYGDPSLVLVQSIPAADGFDLLTYRHAVAITSSERGFARLRVTPAP